MLQSGHFKWLKSRTKQCKAVFCPIGAIQDLGYLLSLLDTEVSKQFGSKVVL